MHTWLSSWNRAIHIYTHTYSIGGLPTAVVPVPQSVTMVTLRSCQAQASAKCATSLIRPRHASGDAAPSSMTDT